MALGSALKDVHKTIPHKNLYFFIVVVKITFLDFNFYYIFGKFTYMTQIIKYLHKIHINFNIYVHNIIFKKLCSKYKIIQNVLLLQLYIFVFI